MMPLENQNIVFLASKLYFLDGETAVAVGVGLSPESVDRAWPVVFDSIVREISPLHLSI